MNSRGWILLFATSWVLIAAEGPGQNPERLQIAVEALQKLKSVDLEANPALKTAVLKVLKQTEGTPAFVELVRDLHLTGQNPALLAFAGAHPDDPAADEALRLVLRDGGAGLLQEALRGPDGSMLVAVLG